MHDWNHDGKIDRKDRMRDYYIYNELKKKECNPSRIGSTTPRSVERNTVRQSSLEGSSEGNVGVVVVMSVIIFILVIFLLM